ncbi:MAG: 23S rRNA (adenine(2503)-C(2))-methyltransferase RlmN [Elusimicrobia bacterium]|nr:23S rRNA (adenine(2503)-C(2))-methyltransferase RlmN [Elusimicrobiota bacterium]
MMTDTPHLLDLTPEEQEALLQSVGAEPYRLRQIVTWFFERRVSSFQAMSDLPQRVRDQLTDRMALRALELSQKQVSSRDGTAKYQFTAVRVPHDQITTVLLPAVASDYTACVSTQIGCGYACAFCASGLVKFQQNLMSSEIVEQILRIEEDLGQRIRGVLFMGMGEPLANYRHVVQAIRWMQAPHGLHLGAHHMTLSTSGLVPQIKRLAEDGVRVRLAVSLHAASEELRRKLLPVASTYTIRELLKACRFYTERTGQPTTIEYILLAGVNDTLRDAQRLSNLLRRFPGHVNLIPYNPVEGLPFQTPSSDSVHKFQMILRQRGIRAFVRSPKGIDLGAGCGQLGGQAIS